MMKSCKYCGRIHDYNYACLKKPKRKHSEKYIPNEKLVRFRHKAAWEKARVHTLERDIYLCRWCYKLMPDNAIKRGRLEVHHIVPLAENMDLGLEDSNLITLCPNHHSMAEIGMISREELKTLAVTPVFKCPPM